MRLRRNADAPPDPEDLPHRQTAAWGRDRDEQTYAAPTGLGVPELDELIRDLDHHKLGTGCRQALAFAFRSADIGAGGWRWTSHSPTGSGPEGSSPNELRFGSLVSLPLLDMSRGTTTPGAAADRKAR